MIKALLASALTALLCLGSAAALACPGDGDGQHQCKSHQQNASGDHQCPHKQAAKSESGWVCPMGPECSGIQAQGGKCAECGMKLIPLSEYNKKK